MKTLPFTLTLLTLATASGRAAEEAPLLIARGEQLVNATGGRRGYWRNNGGQIAAASARDEDGYLCLRIQFDVAAPRQNVGHWFALRHHDLRSYGAVRLTLRGRDGGEMLAFGLKDDRWYEERIHLEPYLGQPLSREWKTLTIPLTAFGRVRQWDSMDNVSISFSHSDTFRNRGQVLIREVTLLPAEKPLLLPPQRRRTYPIAIDPASASDEELLELVERASFEYFWNEANPETGLIKDRCYAFGPDERDVASLSAVGFALSAICVADKRGWVPHEEAYERVLRTLQYFQIEAQMFNGFYFHFYDMDTGAPFGESEVSSVDTGLFLLGVITAKQYYAGTDVERVAQQLLEQVNWDWMRNGKVFLSMGWYPGNRFIPHQWRDYNEGLLLYFLGIGARRSGLAPKVWEVLNKESARYANYEFIPGSGENPLFIHQYPQIWLDLRDRVDPQGINYFANSVTASLANHTWCRRHSDRYRTFAEGYWGLTASDGPREYTVYGAPFGKSDGTVAPTAVLGSIPFVPELALEQLRKYFTLADRIWGKYGFVDAFNLEADWFSSVHIAIDQGATLLMIENYRTGMIWDLVSREPIVQRAFARIGFQPMPSPEVKDETKRREEPSPAQALAR